MQRFEFVGFCYDCKVGIIIQNETGKVCTYCDFYKIDEIIASNRYFIKNIPFDDYEICYLCGAFIACDDEDKETLEQRFEKHLQTHDIDFDDFWASNWDTEF